MSRIMKLRISGIRSFSNESHQVIEFVPPVTLIVGPNGSGKTTIIECLKYITTGEMPANTKQGAFLIDPKIVQQTEVRALIQMKFQNVTGEQMSVTRRIQATQKASKIETKTLEGVMEWIDSESGEKKQLTTKCANIDDMVAFHLGVTPAVLSYVIFCHQDDALWPLGEGKQLKERFDDIFAATRYTEALDGIKKLVKERTAELKELRQDLAHLKEKNEKVTEIQRDIVHYNEQIEANKAKSTSITSQLAPLEQQLNESYAELEKISKIDQRIAVLQATIKSNEEESQRLQRQIKTIMTESDEELQSQKANFQATQAEHQRALTSLEEKCKQYAVEKQVLEKRSGKYMSELGALNHAVEENQRRSKELNQSIDKIAREYSIAGFDSQNHSPDLVPAFLATFNRYLETQKDSQSRLQSEFKRVGTTLNARISELKGKYAATRAIIDEKEQAIMQQTSKLEELKRKTDSQSNSQAKSDDQFRTEIEKIKLEVESKRAELVSAEFPAQIKAFERERQLVEAKITENNEQLRIISQEMKLRTSIEMKQKELETKKAHYQQRLDDTHQDIISVFGESTTRNLSSRLEKIIDSHNTALKEARSKLSALKTERASKSSTQSHLKKRVDTLTDDLNLRRSQIMSVCGTTAFSQYLTDRREELETARNEHELTKSAISLYTNFERKATDKKNCPLCLRKYDSDDALNNFLALLRGHVSKFPERDARLQEQVDRAEEAVQRAESLIGVHAPIDDMEKSLLSIQEQLHDVTESLENSWTDELEAEAHVNEVQAKVTAATGMRTACQELERLSSEVSQLESHIQSESSLLISSDQVLSIDQINAASEELHDEVEAIRRKIERTQKNKEQKEQILAQAEKSLNLANERFLEAKTSMENTRRWKEEMATLKELQQTTTQQIKDLKLQIEPLQSQLDQANSEYDIEKRKFDREYEALSSVIKAIERSKSLVEAGANEINKFHASGTDRKLVEVKACKESTDLEITAVTSRNTKSVEEAQILRERLNNNEMARRTLDDNLRLRALQASMDNTNAEIQRKRSERASLDSSSLGRSHDAMQRQLDNLRIERAKIEGEIKMQQQHIQERERELKSPLYKDAKEQYKSKQIVATATDLVTADLNLYYRTLDKAIMQFHSRKMQEINAIIKELWNTTYTGTDIDFIMIQADTDDGQSEKDALARRSFNYRVVMMKGDTQLDMRGRCSAGQRVLACIIIRLALAETFCSRCGVMTLDEPTTNLDESNSQSLALALVKIIEARRAQSNFQLVVITHDEEFVRQLGQRNITDSFYRISRDENNRSTISRLPINELE